MSNLFGQVMRMIRYDRSANEAQAIPVLDLIIPSMEASPTTTTTTPTTPTSSSSTATATTFTPATATTKTPQDNNNIHHPETTTTNTNIPLKWHRLDDGVMGGTSQTNHEVVTMMKVLPPLVGPFHQDPHHLSPPLSSSSSSSCSVLHFAGTIQTHGGGFCSIRSPISRGSLFTQPSNRTNTTTTTCYDTTNLAIRLQVCGDGNTYKCLLCHRELAGRGPLASQPTWQADIPTIKTLPPTDVNAENPSEAESSTSLLSVSSWQEVTLPLNTFAPSFGGGPTMSSEMLKKYTLIPEDMTEIGIMLSLKLSDGSPNPKETFGGGESTFPFSLYVKSIEVVHVT